MKGPSGVEYPIFHVTYPTSDGRWMVAGCKDGKIVMLPDFYQSEEDARLVSATLNERESERYRTEVIDTVQAKVRFDRGHHRQPGAPEHARIEKLQAAVDAKAIKGAVKGR